MSDTAIVELVIGIVTLLLTAAGGAIGSYVATRNSISELKTEFGSLAAQLAAFRDWLEKVADGDTASVSEIRTKLGSHEKRLDNHDERIGGLERVTAVLQLKGGMKDER
jgi:hypothetical protein